ncbi:MAG: PglZ domain-containing protein [Bacteroidia bacterium]|nr:PglZ domain-containing protein [Bacteroidia bacterium]
MNQAKILWADDEIELLKPHILFLNQKGFQVTAVTNGVDAVEKIKSEDFDIVFLDENMPGISGLEALTQIKSLSSHTPVIMITKSEEEHIMEDAIGNKISDYLIKPVNPNQILLSCKKILEGKSLVSQKTNRNYQQDFRQIGMAFYDDLSADNWADIYKKLVFWEMELEKSADTSMKEVFLMQKAEANVNFAKFITQNYLQWMKGKGEKPILSPDIFPKKVFPILKESKEPLFFLLVDCLRYDQWKMFEEILVEWFTIEESTYYSILPTATQYARNSIFAGLYPIQIAKKFPKYWKDDDEEGGKNLHEADLLQEQIVRNRLNIKHSYTKVVSNEDGKAFADNIQNLMHNDLNAVVINFIDLLSHARAEMNLVKELAPNEAAYRSLSKSWLEHSSLLVAIKKLKELKARIILTTDHGTIRVIRPLKIIGDRTTTTNLRYKQGKNLNYEESKMIFSIRNPEEAQLPKMSVSATYAFTTQDCFFIYPNNYNYYANYYKDTFQHGGISMEEMIIPFVILKPKS